MRVPQREVPIEWRRKAVQHLESIRGTPMAPVGSESAEILPDVCPIYRPDISGIAYWEFEVAIGAGAGAGAELLTTDAALASPWLTEQLANRMGGAQDRSATIRDRGFIMVSTGEHDFPVPHWSFQRPPVSRQLESEAGEASTKVARIYKVDALAYVAEDEAGQEVARSGQTPVPLEGLGHNIDRHAGQISSLTARPERTADDNAAQEIRHAVSRGGPKAPELRATEPSQWRELKDRYADVFGPLLTELRRRARGPWEVDKLVQQYGEGVIAGEGFSIGLLRREAAIEVTGDGASLIDLEVEEKAGRPPHLRGRARPSPRERETEFQLHIRYPDDEEETLHYFVVSRQTPSNVRAERQPGEEMP